MAGRAATALVHEVLVFLKGDILLYWKEGGKKWESKSAWCGIPLLKDNVQTPNLSDRERLIVNVYSSTRIRNSRLMGGKVLECSWRGRLSISAANETKWSKTSNIWSHQNDNILMSTCKNIYATFSVILCLLREKRHWRNWINETNQPEEQNLFIIQKRKLQNFFN